MCKIYLLSSLRLSSSDWRHRQGLWLTHVRYQTQQGLVRPLGLTACSSAMAQSLLSESPRKLPVSWRVWPALLVQREMHIPPSLQLWLPFFFLSSCIPLSFLPLFFIFFPSPDFLTLVTKHHPVTTCLMLRCRCDDTVGSFIVVCDVNHLGMAQART